MVPLDCWQTLMNDAQQCILMLLWGGSCTPLTLIMTSGLLPCWLGKIRSVSLLNTTKTISGHLKHSVKLIQLSFQAEKNMSTTISITLTLHVRKQSKHQLMVTVILKPCISIFELYYFFLPPFEKGSCVSILWWVDQLKNPKLPRINIHNISMN